MHVHRDAAEAFIVLEGTYLMYLGDPQEVCPPGTFVYVPREALRTFKVLSREPGTELNLVAPAAIAGFFEDLAEDEAAGSATAELLGHIAGRHAMEVVAPVPEAYL